VQREQRARHRLRTIRVSREMMTPNHHASSLLHRDRPHLAPRNSSSYEHQRHTQLLLTRITSHLKVAIGRRSRFD
jgi:hypothetical protein